MKYHLLPNDLPEDIAFKELRLNLDSQYGWGYILDFALAAFAMEICSKTLGALNK